MEDKRKNYSKMFLLLSIAYITCLIVSNIIAGKMIQLLSFTLPAAVLVFPITYILADVFTEVYGYKKMKTVIWTGFACNCFAVLMYMIAIWLPYPDFWINQDAFETVLSTTPRILAASLLGYLFGEFSNSIILSKLKIITKGNHLWIRTILSTVVGEAFDTIIFISISFVGTVTNRVLLTMMVCQYCFKVLYELVFTPITYLVVKKIKNFEKIDTFDNNTKYRIF